MVENSNVKNLSIGWVVEANIVDGLTPGYKPIRKIVYKDYGDFGTDVLYKNKKVPIIYPIVEFKKQEDLALLTDGEYIILPYGVITNYLKTFGISLDKSMSYFTKLKIKNIIFDERKIVQPIRKRDNVDSTILTSEIKKLSDFKVYSSPLVPNSDEYEYLNNLTKVYYR